MKEAHAKGARDIDSREKEKEKARARMSEGEREQPRRLTCAYFYLCYKDRAQRAKGQKETDTQTVKKRTGTRQRHSKASPAVDVLAFSRAPSSPPALHIR